MPQTPIIQGGVCCAWGVEGPGDPQPYWVEALRDTSRLLLPTLGFHFLLLFQRHHLASPHSSSPRLEYVGRGRPGPWRSPKAELLGGPCPRLPLPTQSMALTPNQDAWVWVRLRFGSKDCSSTGMTGDV